MAARALAAASLLLGMATTGLALDAPALPSVDEARKFTLEQVGAYKVLTNLAAKRQYVLYPVEAQAPADADLAGVALPAGFQRRTMSVPAQKVSQSLVVVVDRSALRCAMCVCV